VIQISEFPEQGRVLPATITVVNWNAQKASDPQFQEDLQTLIDWQKPDIVFLQEAHVELLKVKEIGGYFANGWSYPWPGGITIGVLTLSKVPPKEVRPIHSKYREFFVTAPKVSLTTEHLLPNGETLLAVNVHLLNFERWGVMKLRSQLEELESIMEQHSGPIIMAGDFNTWNQKRLSLVKELAEDLQLTEVTDVPSGRTTGDMHSGCLNWLFGIKKDLPLDRVYYRGFEDHSAQLLSYDSSDHKAIKVSLTLDGG
jgi:endonuclease/exonuclease/phosphatase (EEP) superfamily protein YafD